VGAYLSFSLKGFDSFIELFDLDDKVVEAGVVSTGEAAAYAEVWEWGNARQTKQGPKTVRGTNPDGEVVWLSSQAPMGYIAVNSEAYLNIVKIELGKLSFSGNSAQDTEKELKAIALSAAQACAEIIAEHAPIDSGQLKGSFEAVPDGDPALDGDLGGSIDRVMYLKGKV
jgi:hypothetical protein